MEGHGSVENFVQPVGEIMVFRSRSSTRVEKRIPMAVAVRIATEAATPEIETTFTEDVSTNGARIFSARKWKANDRLQIATLTGGFRSIARVAWCLPVRDDGFAIGIQLLESSGKWVIPPAASDSRARAS